MQYIQTKLQDVWIYEPTIFHDERGYFTETWNEISFNKGIQQNIHFIQDNESSSKQGVLRGLHYQKGKYSQAKLVRVIQGEVLDVVVDLRKKSPTFGKHISVSLSSENKRQLFIPRGMAHGFQVLSETAIFAYKVDNSYTPNHEACIKYDDPTLNIKWPIIDHNLCLSNKDINKSTSFLNADYF